MTDAQMDDESTQDDQAEDERDEDYGDDPEQHNELVESDERRGAV